MAENLPHHYYNTVHWTGERKGRSTVKGLPDMEVATPPEFPKGHPNIWSPEHLYLASANACLMTTFLAIAENSKLDFISFQSEGLGKLDRVDGKYMMTEIELTPTVAVRSAADAEKAKRLMIKAEENCLISYSMKTKTTLFPVIQVKE